MPSIIIDVPVNLASNSSIGATNGRVKFENIQTSELSQSWMEFFKQKNPALASMLSSGYTIMNIVRPKNRKKIWNLNEKISTFINSFQRVAQKYHAVIGKKKANTGSNCRAQSSQQNQRITRQVTLAHVLETRASTNSTTNPPTTFSEAFRHMNEQQKANQASAQENDSDDVFMHSTNTQDVLEPGIRDENIKVAVVQRIQELNNNTILRVRHEVLKLLEHPNYFRATHYAPQAISFLQYILYVNNSTQN